MDPAYEMSPTLKMPAEARMTSGGSSSGDGSSESSSDIQTELAPEELHAHFSLPMESAGWQLLEGESSDHFAWSV